MRFITLKCQQCCDARIKISHFIKLNFNISSLLVTVHYIKLIFSRKPVRSLTSDTSAVDHVPMTRLSRRAHKGDPGSKPDAVQIPFLILSSDYYTAAQIGPAN